MKAIRDNIAAVMLVRQRLGAGPASDPAARQEGKMGRWTKAAASAAVIGGLVGLAMVQSAAAQGKGDPMAGEALYKTRCAACHGPIGAGDGPTGQKLKEKPSNWTKGEGLKGLTDQQVFDTIKKGGPATGKSKAMLAFPKLSDAEVWNLVAYVKKLGGS
jgi:mono/diheme cytochrome c family protein